jgi:hypothetical protein
MKTQAQKLNAIKMSRPTPETDAEWDKYIRHPYTHGAGDLRILLQRLERERDEAREKYDALAAEHMLVVNKLCNERDEAREAIPAGEWVAHEDYKKVHDAASRLLVAINKELPIGCFTLVSSEYYRLQNAIYGREVAK